MRTAIAPKALSDLIGAVYDCALDPGRWPDTLTQIYEALDFAVATLSLLHLGSGETPLFVSAGIAPTWLESQLLYARDAVEIWGGMEKMLAFPLDEPVVLSRVTARSVIEANRFYREWARPQGIRDVIALLLTRDQMAMGSLGLGRHESKGEIGELEVGAAKLLLPHLQRAATISRLLDIKAVATSTFRSALDTFAIGVVLTDVDLGIVHANAAAEAMLAAGAPIRSERGRLSVYPPALASAVFAAVRQAAENESAMGRRGFGIPSPTADGPPIVLHVLSLQHGALRRGLVPAAAAAIFIAPAVSPLEAPEDAVAALYDLTPAEARVFAKIASGMRQSEVARTLGVEPTTVKTHLLHVFAKTGTRRQADLVKLGAALALPLRS